MKSHRAPRPCAAACRVLRALAALALLGGLRSPAGRGGEVDPPCNSDLVPLVPPIVLDLGGPQGIARDAGGDFWITSALSLEVRRVTSDLEVAGGFTAGITRVENPFGNNLAGIAYNAERDTLFVCRPFTSEIWELEKDGTPTGFVLFLDLPPPVNIIPRPFPKGIAFDPDGDAGAGSFWVVESVMTAVYEVSVTGRILSSFCHPDDPDGCPGSGRAAFGNDIGMVLDGDPFLELTGGSRFRDRILRTDIDGVPTGLAYPLGASGGRPGGFLRTRIASPVSGEPVDVFLVTVESSDELQVLEIREPRLLPILGLSCSADPGGGVTLRWRDAGAYGAIDVLREGEPLARLDGTAVTFTDTAPPPGILDYEVVASSGECTARASCEVTIGPGQVLASLFIDDLQIVDLTEDAEDDLWVTYASGEIGVFTKELEQIFFFDGPFRDDGDVTSGIAFNPRSPSGDPTFFVYNASTDMVVEIDGSGEPVDAPFWSGVPSDPEDPALVTSMLFDPEGGGGGAGSFWYVDYTSGTIQERGRDGELLFSCVHPDARAEPPPESSTLKAYAWGISPIPGDAGPRFGPLEISGGRIRDGGTTRILRVQLDADSCEPTGYEIPASGIAAVHEPVVLNLLHTTHGGREVIFAVDSNTSPSTRLFEIDAAPPPVPAVAGLECVQGDRRPDVDISFRVDSAAAAGIDRIDVLRDGAPLVALPGDARSLTDEAVPPGRHVYTVRLARDDVAGDDRSCELTVGPGSIARRRFSAPISLIHQIAFDPAADLYVAASTSNRFSDSLHLFDRDLAPAGEIPSPFTLPEQVAALAVRARGASTEYHCLGWMPGSPPEPEDGEARLPVRVTGLDGEVVRELTVPLPAPRRSLVVFPSGMAWDAATDTLWILERNSRTLTNVDLDGNVIASFPHPAPVAQDGVINFGLAASPSGGALYVTSAGPLDRRITRLVEIDTRGRLTGFELPLGDGGYYEHVRGFALAPGGLDLVVAASAPRAGVADLVEHRAFAALGPIEGLSCAPEPGAPPGTMAYRLSWRGEAAGDRIEVYRNGDLVAELPPEAVSFLDAGAPSGCGAGYRVVRTAGGIPGPGAICEGLPPEAFLRGDVEEDGRLTISDAIAILSFLFLGAGEPACLDAADADDSGNVSITDGVVVLDFLFLAGAPPRPPYPYRGCDPTPDALGCPRS